MFDNQFFVKKNDFFVYFLKETFLRSGVVHSIKYHNFVNANEMVQLLAVKCTPFNPSIF